MKDVIEISGLVKRYGAEAALDDVSVTVPPGKVVGLMGHNGAGKSTLIKLILGLITPTSGDINVLGESPNGQDSRENKRRIGYLPENVAFYDNLSGSEVIRYFSELKRTPVQKGYELLENLGLKEAASKRVRMYSKGMRQRLGVAQALIGSPDLLLLDEPTTGLDPMGIRDFFELISDLRKQGKSILISSHILAEIEPHLDIAIILGKGRLLAHGTVSEMRQRAGLPVIITARFGEEQRDLFEDVVFKDLLTGWNFISANVIEMYVSVAYKMKVIHAVMNITSLIDIEVKEPTLADLYATVGVNR